MSAQASIFLIANPTHYINCVEYLQKFPITGKKILVVVSEFAPVIREMQENIFTEISWDDELVFDYSDITRRLSERPERKKVFREIYAYLKELSFNKIVIGNLGDALFYSLLHRLKSAGKIFTVDALDDGTPSIKILQSRENGSFYKLFHNKPVKILLKDFLSFGIFLPAYKPIEEVIFFSIYDINPGGKDILIKNEYAGLKEKYRNALQDGSTAIFVGSTLVEKNMVDEKIYVQKINAIAESFQKEDIKLIYLMHRLEHREKLSRLHKNISIQMSSLPIEIALLNYASIPCSICSFFSSALDNLRKILPADYKIISFRLPNEYIQGTLLETKADIIGIYDKLSMNSEIITKPI